MYNDDNDSSFSFEKQNIIEKNAKDISTKNLTKIKLNKNEFICFQYTFKMYGCKYEVEALKRIKYMIISINLVKNKLKINNDMIDRYYKTYKP